MLVILITLSYDLAKLSLQPYQWYYNFTVRVRLEIVWLLQLLPDNLVVVDLTVDS